MNRDIYIKKLNKKHLSKVKSIIEENDMFPPDMLDDMVEGYLADQSEEIWLVAENDHSDVVAMAYSAPERMTEGTWNLLLIAVTLNQQGICIGSKLINHVEETLMKLDVRFLLVETSSLADFELTRGFYPKCGYAQVATTPDYYSENDGKVIFLKYLN